MGMLVLSVHVASCWGAWTAALGDHTRQHTSSVFFFILFYFLNVCHLATSPSKALFTWASRGISVRSCVTQSSGPWNPLNTSAKMRLCDAAVSFLLYCFFMFYSNILFHFTLVLCPHSSPKHQKLEKTLCDLWCTVWNYTSGKSEECLLCLCVVDQVIHATERN